MHCNICNKKSTATCCICSLHFCNEKNSNTSLSHILKHIKQTKHLSFNFPGKGVPKCAECGNKNIVELWQNGSVFYCQMHKKSDSFQILQKKKINFQEAENESEIVNNRQSDISILWDQIKTNEEQQRICAVDYKNPSGTEKISVIYQTIKDKLAGLKITHDALLTKLCQISPESANYVFEEIILIKQFQLQKQSDKIRAANTPSDNLLVDDVCALLNSKDLNLQIIINLSKSTTEQKAQIKDLLNAFNQCKQSEHHFNDLLTISMNTTQISYNLDEKRQQLQQVISKLLKVNQFTVSDGSSSQSFETLVSVDQNLSKKSVSANQKCKKLEIKSPENVEFASQSTLEIDFNQPFDVKNTSKLSKCLSKTKKLPQKSSENTQIYTEELIIMRNLDMNFSDEAILQALGECCGDVEKAFNLLFGE